RNGKQFRQWDDVLRLDEDQAIAEEPARLEGGERGRTSHEAPALTRQRFGARERALEAPLHPEQVVGERVHRPGAGGDDSAEREIAAQNGFRQLQLDSRVGSGEPPDPGAVDADDETGDPSVVYGRVGADIAVEQDPRAPCPERSGALHLGAETRAAHEAAAPELVTELGIGDPRLVVVALIVPFDDEGEAVPQVAADPGVLCLGEVRTAQHEARASAPSLELEPALERPTPGGVPDPPVESRLHPPDRREQDSCSPPQPEGVHAIVGRGLEPVRTSEIEERRGGFAPDDDGAPVDHDRVRREWPVDHLPLDPGQRRWVEPAAEVQDIPVDASRGAQEDVCVHPDQVAGDRALERQRRPRDEQRPGDAVPRGDESVARDEKEVAPGKEAFEAGIEVDVASAGEYDRLPEPDGGPERQERGQEEPSSHPIKAPGSWRGAACRVRSQWTRGGTERPKQGVSDGEWPGSHLPTPAPPSTPRPPARPAGFPVRRSGNGSG